jgi:hypothetical protein
MVSEACDKVTAVLKIYVKNEGKREKHLWYFCGMSRPELCDEEQTLRRKQKSFTSAQGRNAKTKV